MTKVEAKKLAIEEVAELMKKYIDYVEAVKDKPFTTEIREQLLSKGKIIRWLQEGLENGYYES
jgi:hypothetical protein